MTVTLAIYSNKGGVGKTTASVNLSYLAAQSGLRTLICDLDPQSSATYYFRVKPKLKRKALGFIRWNKQVDRSIKGTDYKNLDLLPADIAQRNLDLVFFSLKNSERRLRQVLKPLKKEYDLIVIDSLSTINILADNIFNAADYVVVPMIPTTLSVRSYRQLLNFVKAEKYDPRRVYAFFSMVDRRKKMHNELVAEVSENFDGILRNLIPYMAVIEKMGITRQPVPVFAPRSDATLAYNKLWREIRGKVFTKKIG